MNTDHYASDLSKDDEEWQATRYVLGEMAANEAEAFERQLAGDQAARERVAWAAGLVAGLHDAEPSATSFESPSSISCRLAGERVRGDRRLLALVGVAAAICALVAVGLHVFSFSVRDFKSVDERVARDANDNGAGHLVAIWSERLGEMSAIVDELGPNDTELGDAGVEASAPADLAEVGSHAARTNADPLADPDQVAPDDFHVPGWLLAAVSQGAAWNLEN